MQIWKVVDKRLDRVTKMVKQRDKDAILEEPVLQKLKEAFENELPARSVELSEDEYELIKGMHLLTIKPMLYVANVDEDEIANTEDNEYVNPFVNLQRWTMQK